MDNWVSGEGPIINHQSPITNHQSPKGVEAVAVCLLHSYANPAHERRIGQIVAEDYPEARVSLSCEILPEFKEYERMSTTVINAYVMPIMEGYLRDLSGLLEGIGVRSNLHIMQSSGEIVSSEAASKRSVYTIFSGPVGGVLGALALARGGGS